MTSYAHELNGFGTACATDCPACKHYRAHMYDGMTVHQMEIDQAWAIDKLDSAANYLYYQSYWPLNTPRPAIEHAEWYDAIHLALDYIACARDRVTREVTR